MSPMAAASSAGSFSSRTVVRYAATSASLFRYSAASNSGSSETLTLLDMVNPPKTLPAQSLAECRPAGWTGHRRPASRSPTRRAGRSTCASLAQNVRASRTRLRLQVPRRPSCQAGPCAAA